MSKRNNIYIYIYIYKYIYTGVKLFLASLKLWEVNTLLSKFVLHIYKQTRSQDISVTTICLIFL